MRPGGEGARRDRERERALQGGQLAVDRRVPRAFLLSPEDVAADVRRRDRGQAAPAEERAEVQPHVAFDVEERALAVHAVVVEDVAHGGAEARPGERRREDPGHAVAAFQARCAHVSLARPADARRDRFRIARGLILVIDAVTEAAPPARGASPGPFAERTRLAGGRHLSGMIWRRAMDDDGSMIDEYLDAAGTVRTFRLAVYRDGQFLEAVERRDGARAGLRFVLPVRAGEPPWGEMREGIRAWLARRDVARHPRSGRLELLTRSLRGQIDAIGDDGEPVVLVDDLEIGWDELGRLLASYEGWHLRIEVRDPSEAFD